MIEDIDAGTTDPLYWQLTDNGTPFDGTGFTVALELLKIGGLVWHAATAYVVDDVVRPTVGNGRLYRVTVAGTTDVVEPTWPLAPGGTVLDGTVEFTEETPDCDWFTQAAGIVRVLNANLLPAGTSYRVRYAVTDGIGKVGYFPNKNRYDVWRIGGVIQA